MTVGRIMALFMKTVQLSSQCRAHGKCSCRLPQFTFPLLTVDCPFVSQTKTSCVIVSFSLLSTFPGFPFLPPSKRSRVVSGGGAGSGHFL